MNFKAAQKDMREGYLGGSTGVFASGIVWLLSGITAMYATQTTSISVLFFGGMLIFPMGVLLAKFFGHSGKHKKENPLGKLAMETTILLFIGLFIAYSIMLVDHFDFFFPIMLMIIGGRYIIFQSIYGMRLYWILGLVLIGAGVIGLVNNLGFNFGAIAGGVIELAFAIIIGKFGKTSDTVN